VHHLCNGLNVAAMAPDHILSSEERRESMANTTSITDKIERKKVKRAARKAAAPKAPRTGARGENKAKIKKAARGQSKR
jgi:hypothetical protein